MKRILALSGLLVLLALGNAMALVDRGEPYDTNSWVQRFEETGVGNFNFMQVAMFTAGDLFEAPVFSNFTDNRWKSAPLTGTPVLAWSIGPTTTWLQFDITFYGAKSDPLGFTFQAYELLPGGGWTLKESVDATWNGSGWSFAYGNTANLTMPVIPETTTLMMALMGLGSVAGLRRLRKS
ncbi:MAG: hypothetical protein QHI38_07040 [Armatimonadota bacterium]|nr:hypothetical protein [Armatimonadota bacterium]